MTVVETPVKEPAREAGQDFIRDIVRADLVRGHGADSKDWLEIMDKAEFDLKTDLISDAVTDFAVGFVDLQVHNRKEKAFSAGSGTFVSIGSVYGILTAAHVLKALPQSGPVGIALNYRDPLQFRRLFIEMQYSDCVFLADKTSEARGPDLAFLRLCEADVAKIKALAVFYNLLRREYLALTNVRSAKNYVDAITGIVAEETKELPSTKPNVVSTNFFSIFVDGLSIPVDDNEDIRLFEFEAAPRPGFNLPSDYRGVSGGAVWRFDVDLESKPPKVVQKILFGVAFHQSDSKDGKRTITCHGPRDVYARLLNKIRERWPEETGPGLDFIRQIVQGDLLSGKQKSVAPAFRRSRTATCISATPSRFASISASPASSAATAICATTTPTRPRNPRNISTPSSATCAGSASIGARTSIMRRIISSSFTAGPRI